MTAAQAIAARRKAQIDKRYKYGRREASTHAKRLAEKLAREKAFNLRKGAGKK